MNPKRLGDNLRKARAARGLTLVQVEKATGIKQPQLSRYETGKTVPPLPALVTLAKFYGVAVADLMKGV